MAADATNGVSRSNMTRRARTAGGRSVGATARVRQTIPGTIDTEIHASGGQPDRAARIAPSIPMQRAGRAEEIAAAVVFLLSDAASYTTGAIVDVSGGR